MKQYIIYGCRLLTPPAISSFLFSDFAIYPSSKLRSNKLRLQITGPKKKNVAQMYGLSISGIRTAGSSQLRQVGGWYFSLPALKTLAIKPI